MNRTLPTNERHPGRDREIEKALRESDRIARDRLAWSSLRSGIIIGLLLGMMVVWAILIAFPGLAHLLATGGW